ncbi:hypothetical protein ACFL5T_04900 [Gemmatimonadota bacterium]
MRSFDQQLGRYAIPICRTGRWNQFIAPAYSNRRDSSGEALGGDSCGLDFEQLVSRWHNFTDTQARLKEWAAVIVLRIVDRRWVEPSGWIPMDDYLDRCIDDEEERIRCFLEMLEYLADDGQ